MVVGVVLDDHGRPVCCEMWPGNATDVTSLVPVMNLKSLQEIEIEDSGRTMVIRTECLGTYGKVFQSVGVAIPPTIREAT
ncbi:MAG: hypothetical protein WC560_02120 [Syntrophales bacterium]